MARGDSTGLRRGEKVKGSRVILGAGLAGIGCAREWPDAVVYEAKDHPGGHVWSHEQDGVHFDEGAHICHAKDEAWRAQLVKNAGRVVDIAQSRIASYWHGHWIAYPVQNHLRDLPAELRDRALSDLLAAQKTHAGRTPANYEEWVRFQYGEFLSERFYREYTDKYWRTPMEAMDTDWLSGRLLPAQIETITRGAREEHDEKQAVFASFLYPERGGFYSFFRPFTQGLDIRTGARLVELNPRDRSLRFADGRVATYGKLVSTIPLPDLVAAITEAPEPIRTAAQTLRHTRMLGVNIVLNRADVSPYHWFYIYDADIDVSRVKVMSNVTPVGCPPNTTVLQAEVFRRDDEVFDEKALAEKAISDLGRILNFDYVRDVLSAKTILASHAYPIPTLGRSKIVEPIISWLASLGIESDGLYGRWKYVWSNEAYRVGAEVGRRMLGLSSLG